MTIKVELQKILIIFFSRRVQIGILGLQLIWIFLHFIVSSFYFLVSIATTLESYLISCGFLRKYNHLDIDRVQYLAIVVESDEAYNTLKIIELLQWLESMGIRSVCLYDAEASDGKEAVARAASFLLKDKWRKTNMSGDSNQCFSESQMTEALKAVGCGGPDPDLILVYGPSRCHLGFPAWRIRYTEIIHMGPLKSKKYGSLVKAIYKFTMVRQNYGK
ncbi:Dehydrodolichyl diphosphate synthase complex subunit nus1 [Cucurbita argyrosperma subsp. argyrosperma]|nr:Dehydrodolichyl diphosphate synthase complex subunit nus1 [Cucurbita argyrosperma subsp. argyrosperma]